MMTDEFVGISLTDSTNWFCGQVTRERERGHPDHEEKRQKSPGSCATSLNVFTINAFYWLHLKKGAS